MDCVKLNLSKINEEDLGKFTSHILGDVSIPRKWLEEDIFDENDIFFAQINLEDLSYFKLNLDKKGMLYFFVDISDELNPKCKVFLSKENDLAIVNFNEGVENISYNLEKPYQIKFKMESEMYLDGTKMFGNAVEQNLEDEILLMQFDSLEYDDIDFLQDNQYLLQFFIKKIDLQKNDFSKVSVKLVCII